VTTTYPPLGLTMAAPPRYAALAYFPSLAY
jgi:hypothetical protein